MGFISRMSFFSKNLLLSVVNIILVGVVLTVSSYFIQGNLLIQSLHDQAVGYANLANSLIDPQEVTKAFSETDLQSATQQAMVKKLTEFTEKNENVSNAYIMGADYVNNQDGLVVMVAFSQSVIEQGFKPGDHYQLPEVVMAEVAKMKNTKQPVATDPYTDEFGTWISVMVPIMDNSGNMIAFFAIDQAASIVKEGQNQLMLWSGIVLIIFLAIIIGIQYLSLRKIMAPVKELFAGISEISQGNLNVTLSSKQKDDLGELVMKFNEMAAHLRTIIKGVREGAEKAAASADELSASVEQNSQALNVMADTIHEIANGASVQEHSSKDSSRAMEEMAAGIQRIAETTSAMAESAHHMANESLVGNEYIQRVIDQMAAIHSSVSHSAEVIRALEERSKQIIQIADVISGISSQTNLLALNAAIEAARAGEQGKGFAVVAEEVRKLAEQSQNSANQISALLQEIQDEVEKAVETMSVGTEEVKKGSEVVAETGVKFKNILDLSQSVASQVHEVSAVAEQMSAGSEEVSASIAELAKIAKETAGGSSQVAALSEDQLRAMDDVRVSVENLNQMAQKLKDLIQRFKV